MVDKFNQCPDHYLAREDLIEGLTERGLTAADATALSAHLRTTLDRNDKDIRVMQIMRNAAVSYLAPNKVTPPKKVLKGGVTFYEVELLDPAGEGSDVEVLFEIPNSPTDTSRDVERVYEYSAMYVHNRQRKDPNIMGEWWIMDENAIIDTKICTIFDNGAWKFSETESQTLCADQKHVSVRWHKVVKVFLTKYLRMHYPTRREKMVACMEKYKSAVALPFVQKILDNRTFEGATQASIVLNAMAQQHPKDVHLPKFERALKKFTTDGTWLSLAARLLYIADQNAKQAPKKKKSKPRTVRKKVQDIKLPQDKL